MDAYFVQKNKLDWLLNASEYLQKNHPERWLQAREEMSASVEGFLVPYSHYWILRGAMPSVIDGFLTAFFPKNAEEVIVRHFAQIREQADKSQQ